MYLPAENWDYLTLMGLSDQPVSDAPAPPHVAVLGYCTTLYYAKILRGLGHAAGFPLTTWEADYNTVEQTLLDESSPFWTQRPQFAVFVTAVQALRDLLLSEDLPARQAAAQREAGRLTSAVRRAARLPGVTVVVNTLVVPFERPWGNLTSRVDGSLPSVVARFNDSLRQMAREVENVHLVDCDTIASWLGKRTWFDERLWFHGKNFCQFDALPYVAGQALDIFRAARGKTAKCIALDLDNTLWGGVIGDDGMEGIRLGDLGDGEAFVRFQHWLKELSRRGILLAVCSKNDPDRAREVFHKHRDMVLRESDIVGFIANWNNKADNLRLLAKQLNIGLEAIVFLDDSPFERNLVRQLVPEVCVPEMPEDAAEFVPYLESLNLFEGLEYSDEDRKRTAFYVADVQRDEEQTKFSDVNEYLVSLQMTAEFERFDDEHLPRIAQLVQRTNQFNLTTLRHTAAELKQFAGDPAYFPYYVTLADRFGDNGLISVVIGRRDGDALDIISCLMSCRVIARRLEEFVLDRLAEVAQGFGLGRLRGRFVPTKKNQVVARHYEKLGFVRLTAIGNDAPDGDRSSGATESTWERSLENYVPASPPIAWKRKS